jgi:hypothetical protein
MTQINGSTFWKFSLFALPRATFNNSGMQLFFEFQTGAVMRLFFVFLLPLVLSVAISASSTVDAGPYNTSAITCVPEGSVGPDVYLYTSGSVMHKTGKTDNMTFICPINRETPLTLGGNLRLLYFSTENDPTTYVTAKLKKMSKSTGVTTIIATASSQQGVNDNVSAHSVTQSTPATCDPSAYICYVQLDMRRRNTDQIVIAYAVTLSSSFP